MDTTVADRAEEGSAPRQPRFVPRRSKDWSTAARRSRAAVQSLFVIWFVVTLWQHTVDGEGKGGSVESVCPFGGFETAWMWITTGRTVPHTHLSNLVLAGVVTVLALLARGFFCGWICVLGSIQEGIRTIGRRLEKWIPALHKARRSFIKHATWLPSLHNFLHYGRYAVMVWALGGAALTGVMVFREVDPWSALMSIVEFEFSTAFAVLIFFLVVSLFVDRPFCNYACPLGAVQGLIAKASPVSIQRNSEACLGCDICNEACPMQLPVNQRTRVTDGSCIGCLQCVAACPSRDALSLTVSLPVRVKN